MRHKRKRLLGLLIGLSILLVVAVSGNSSRPHPDSFAGLPRSAQWSWAGLFHVIDPPGFVLGYSEWWRLPLWVAYRLGEPQLDRIGPRPRHFARDRRTLWRVAPQDYRESGFDRGHMAPNYAMARFAGREAQLASFRMSNIAPQRPALNQKLWQRLEEIEADVYVVPGEELWVLAGPILTAPVTRLASGVAVPAAYFRIWLRGDQQGGWEALAFIVPQSVSGTEPLDQFVVSVDAVEAATGLDFFHLLDDAVEQVLEAQANPAAWDLQRHARHPPRY